jgi:hypothetical protein
MATIPLELLSPEPLPAFKGTVLEELNPPERREQIKAMLERQRAKEKKPTPPRAPSPEKHWTQKSAFEMLSNERNLRDLLIVEKTMKIKTSEKQRMAFGISEQELKDARADPRVKIWLKTV